jgi:hypothetical protein
MLELLAKGPMQREELLQQIMPLVPPGEAYRKTLAHRARERSKDRLTDKRIPNAVKDDSPSEETVRIGQRAIATGMMVGSIRDARVVQFYVGDTAWVKYGPNIIHGPAERIAHIRHEQEHGGTIVSAVDCPFWHKHVTEAIELHEAYLPASKKHY